MGHSTPRKKILIGITQSNFFGAQRMVFDLAVGLRDEFDIAVVYGGNGELADKLKEAGIRGISMPMVRKMSFLHEIKSFFFLFKLVRNERPDILHLHSSKMGGIGAVIGRLTGVPLVVFTSHGWEFNAPRPWWQRRIIAVFSTLIVLLSHSTIAVSNATRDAIRFGPARRRIAVVRNGVTEISFLSREDAIRRLFEKVPRLKDHAKENELWIGTLAELHPVKGLRYAIEAIAQLKNEFPTLRYIVMGEGKERATLESQIERLGLGQNVFLAGYVDNARALSRAFDMYVMPSLSESLSLSLIEAGFASRPVVATRVGGVPEVVSDNYTGILVPPADPQALSDTIRTFLRNPEYAVRLGDALYEYVCSEFSMERMLKETKAVYVQMV